MTAGQYCAGVLVTTTTRLQKLQREIAYVASVFGGEQLDGLDLAIVNLVGMAHVLSCDLEEMTERCADEVREIERAQ